MERGLRRATREDSVSPSRDSAVAHEYAVRLALIAFATAAIQGLVTRAAFEPALKLALSAAAVCYLLGWLCGDMARRIVEESVQMAAQPPSPAPASPSTPQVPGR